MIPLLVIAWILAALVGAVALVKAGIVSPTRAEDPVVQAASRWFGLHYRLHTLGPRSMEDPTGIWGILAILWDLCFWPYLYLAFLVEWRRLVRLAVEDPQDPVSLPKLPEDP